MKYFVTGATGFVGGHVARQLIAAGHEVVAVVRTPAKAHDLAGVILHQGDVTEKESMRAPMQGVDGVFHIAGWYKVGVRDKTPGEKINVEGTRNVLELMRELSIPRGVYTSTLAINSDTHGKLVDESYHYTGSHLSEYDRSKWAAHYEVAEPMIAEGLPLTIVMPGLIYGPGDTSSARTTFLQYLQRKLPFIPTVTATRCAIRRASGPTRRVRSTGTTWQSGCSTPLSGFTGDGSWARFATRAGTPSTATSRRAAAPSPRLSMIPPSPPRAAS
jgi:nucleoside-diphosphate-sugar epimerase